jgi:hypothetical protein
MARARKRPLPKAIDTRTGRPISYSQAGVTTDQVSGFTIPILKGVPQRGGLVDSRWSQGTRDRPDKSNW